MIMKKSALTGVVALTLLTAGAAHAQLVIEPVINTAPVVSPPVYATPVVSTWDERHRRSDWEYWHNHHDRDPHWHR